MNNERIESLIKMAEASITEPEYRRVDVIFVDKESAEICITKQHNVADHLILGLVALSKVAQDDENPILVYEMEDDEQKTENVGVFDGDDFKKVAMNSELFLQVVQPVEQIYQKFHGEKFKIGGLGLSMSIQLSVHFAGANQIPEEFLKQLQYENFEDMETAEKNAFSLFKKFYGATIGGIYAELLED